MPATASVAAGKQMFETRKIQTVFKFAGAESVLDFWRSAGTL